MVEILKKQWFVILVSFTLLCFIVFVSWDTNKGKLQGKKVDGLQIVSSVDDTNVSADELYDLMKKSIGNSVTLTLFQNAVIAQSVETTPDLESEAKLLQEKLLKSAKSQYPTTYKTVLAEQLNRLGFESGDLYEYCLTSVKSTKMQDDYISANLDALFTPVYEEKKSRVVSHILIKMTDASNPTEEELAKVKAVEEALASGKDFAEVAKEYSEDTSSATAGGSIGYVDSDSSLVPPFLEASLALEKGQVSEWVKITDSSLGNYQGWHLIKVVENDKTALMENADIKDALYSALNKADSKMFYKILWENAKKLNIEYADENIKAELLEFMGIEE
ncbi:MAG: peptidylprolyl isomerase [Erysipelotrichaceae bacterium]|nr:peptidylprolyl isomerase [Erysipelotrichaceae bacterium]